MSAFESELRLDGRIALVTGAAMGIGAAVATVLGDLGARLVLIDRAGPELAATVDVLEASGGVVIAEEIDVRDTEAVDDFLATLTDEWRPIEILVNNAGGGFHSAFVDIRPKGEAALIAENFTSVTHLIRWFAGQDLLASGSVVNITSIEAHRAGPGYSIYSAMKAAVASLTSTLALELGPSGIRVNAIAPDVIATPGIGIPAITTPLPQAGTGRDVAAAVAFLASDLSRFVTGTTLHVDGGNHAAAGWKRQSDGTFRPD